MTPVRGAVSKEHKAAVKEMVKDDAEQMGDDLEVQVEGAGEGELLPRISSYRRAPRRSLDFWGTVENTSIETNMQTSLTRFYSISHKNHLKHSVFADFGIILY